MEIYKSKRLEVGHNRETESLIQKWSDYTLTAEDFKHEMLNYRDLMLEVKPKRVLWRHDNFNFQIPDSLFEWIETSINIPGKENGVFQIGFVVSQDILSQLSVINAFEETHSTFHPYYFTSYNEALQWLNGGQNEIPSDLDSLSPGSIIELYLEKISDTSITIRLDKNLQQALKMVKQIANEQRFVQKHFNKFRSLTKRESEILMLLAQGDTSRVIGEKLFISKFTVDTHRKNIFEKLEARNSADLFRFAYAFKIVK